MPSHEVTAARKWWDNLMVPTRHYLMNKYQMDKKRTHHTISDIEMSNIHILEEEQKQHI